MIPQTASKADWENLKNKRPVYVDIFESLLSQEFGHKVSINPKFGNIVEICVSIRDRLYYGSLCLYPNTPYNKSYRQHRNLVNSILDEFEYRKFEDVYKLSGKFMSNAPKVEIIATGTTVTAADSGKVYVAESVIDAAILDLPSAAAGLIFTLISHDAGESIGLNPQSSDSIGGEAAGKDFDISSSALRDGITIIGMAGNKWVVVYINGTWVVQS